jgi:hypothetical protein
MTTAEKIAEDVARLVAPLAVEAATAVYELVKGLVTHTDGAELAAKRAGEALAAKAVIRS